MAKVNFKFIPYGSVDFSDPSQIDANVIYIEKDPVDPDMCIMHFSNSSGTGVMTGLQRANHIHRSEIDSVIRDIARVYQPNRLNDGGSFSHTNKLEDNLKDASGNWLGAMVTPSNLNFSSYSAVTRVDSFENNNSTYGGNMSALGTDVLAFMDALGIPDDAAHRRFGRGYAIVEITCDPNHLFTNWTNIRGMQTAWMMYGSVWLSSEVSYGYWVYGVSGDIVPYGTDIYVNDVLSNQWSPKIPNGSWHYIKATTTRENGLGVYPLPLSMSRDSVCRVALPYAAQGVNYPPLTMGDHKWIRS